MASPFSPEVDRLLKIQLATGEYQSEDDVIVAALHALGERNADLEAVNEAIAEMEAGDTGKPLAQVADEIRAKHGWSAD